MTSRKTFDPRDKFNPSSASLARPETSDLQVVIDESQRGKHGSRQKS